MILKLLENEYSVYKFNPNISISENKFDGEFVSITRTKDEISVVAVSSLLDNFENVEKGWKIFKVDEILDFGLIGILSKISTLLAEEMISIYVISTYNTDCIMVKEKNLYNIIEKLRKNGYEIIINGVRPNCT